MIVRPRTTKLSLTRNFVSDQTFRDFTIRVNSAGMAFDATRGLWANTATSSCVIAHIGGFNDQKITWVGGYSAATAVGSENCGPLLRFQGIENAGGSTWYQARINAGFARLSKSVANTVTNLSSAAFALGQDVDVTIVFQVVGNALSATFTAASGPAPVSLSTTDSAITTGGMIAWRSLAQAMYTKSFIGEQL